MRIRTKAGWDELTPKSRRRLAAAALIRSLLATAAIVVGYFVLPLTSHLATDSLVQLAFGLLGVAVLLTWQVWLIVRSPYPAVQALIAMVLTVALFLIIFAATYFLMGDADAANFSEPLTRLDALYYTVTMFATVGFGDIVAVSEVARAVATIQMVLGLVVVGLIARVIVGAVQESRARQARESQGKTDISKEAR